MKKYLILCLFLVSCGSFDGDQGPKGRTGSTGDAGEEGSPGENGHVGPQGENGNNGVNGNNGADGSDGLDGLDAPFNSINDSVTCSITVLSGNWKDFVFTMDRAVFASGDVFVSGSVKDKKHLYLISTFFVKGQSNIDSSPVYMPVNKDSDLSLSYDSVNFEAIADITGQDAQTFILPCIQHFN